MATAHVGIVWNPSKTTKNVLDDAWREALAAANDPDISCSWHETAEDDPGRGATKEAIDAGASVVVAAGGDGTVRAVAEQLAESDSRAELGILPLGTGNLLARNLDVPLNDLAGAFGRVITGQAQPLDAGWVEIAGESGPERHAFVVMAGFGIDAHMITETNDDLKEKAGWLAYVESLGRAVSASEVIDVRIGIDGADLVPHQAHTVIVGNCGTLQGGLTLLPDADPRDGQLDLLSLDSEGVAGWMDTLKNMVWDNGLMRLLGKNNAAEDSGSATHRRLKALVVELDEPRVFEVDGDDLGETTRIEISLQPGAVWVR